MSIQDHWQEQKEVLRPKIADLDTAAEVVQQVRHALLQVEQNALAEFTDDVLRQQAGVLLSGVKQSIGLLEAHMAAQVWVPQKQPKSSLGKERIIPALVAAALVVLLALYCNWKGLLLGTLLAAGALAAGIFAWFWKPAAPVMQDEARVTFKPDTDRLFAILDGQIRSVDRYVKDFSYLNDQLRSGSNPADDASLSRAADLMEVLYECCEEDRASLEEPSQRLLAALGLQALNYSAETSRFFNALPSKTTTRTLSPAIVSVQDQRLLRRGTAAVRMDVA